MKILLQSLMWFVLSFGSVAISGYLNTIIVLLITILVSVSNFEREK